MNKPAFHSPPLKVTKIGDDLAVILSEAVLAKLDAALGDSIAVSETPDGVQLTRYDPDFERQMEVARKIMRDNRDILRELAK